MSKGKDIDLLLTFGSSFCFRLGLPGTGRGASHGEQGRCFATDDGGDEASEARPCEQGRGFATDDGGNAASEARP